MVENNCFETLYDFNEDFPRLFPSVFGIILILIGLMVLKLNLKGRFQIDYNIKIHYAFPIGLILFGIIFFIVTIDLGNYLDTKKNYKLNKFLISEGYVTNIQTKIGRHNRLVFYLNDKCFEFQDRNDISFYGCKYEDLQKYKIKNGAFLKIYYLNNYHPISLKIDRRCEEVEK